ncbi:hypothetical protein LCGC14_0302160 [marine sediment metagenome]|uniref:Thioredoxin domain-containing protein n=1 Tax=marine sediment metagenome TaxID=412755 RepID=A0A0F9WVX3_9ZZZZ|nr:DUF255 domain-containing protein [Phycisphaerae bacterium]HDZ45165.1 DUF255 domain-containing protein [Phycisphaerae bacterium]
MTECRPVLPRRAWWRSLRVLAIVAACVLAAWMWRRYEATEPPDRGLAAQAASAGNTGHQHTNRLANETSPYLLQHAHNPVDWYPWGQEAFDKARREDKPVFVSIGYSTCYWCHVMEKESFEDAEVARLLNENFVAIKVDREERPDIDEQYMLATQLLTQRGGWPNSVWLTPEGKPWMAGTYFPKPQFMLILTRLINVWKTRRLDVENQADQLASAIARIGSGEALARKGEPTSQAVDQAVGLLTRNFDSRHGGFSGAPKFPPHGTLRLLIRQYRDTGNEELLGQITRTLDAMWSGGIHDHVGGGFHRYATDDEWLVPHFEKMLYDNAQLMRVYVDGYLVTGSERYRTAVEDIFGWLQRDMTSPDGAFYSAIDAGEVGKEGQIYLWHPREVADVLGAQDAKLFGQVYGFEEGGNFVEEATGDRRGLNIPHLDEPIGEIAEARGQTPRAFAGRLAGMRQKLLARRQTWAQPHKDDKVLTSWNGLMIASLAYAGRQLDEPRYTEAAMKAADFIVSHMMRGDTLLRTYRADQAKQLGYLDDYAYLAEALIELHQATGDPRWLARAGQLVEKLLDDFQDKTNGGFYFTTPDHEDLLVRSKSISGGGNTPNANGVAAVALLDIGVLTGDMRYVAAARRTLESLIGVMQQSPFGGEAVLVAAKRLGDQDVKEIAAKPSRGLPEAASSERPLHVGGAADELRPDAQKRTDPVTISVYASRLTVRPGETVDLAVSVDIDEGWHLYGENPQMGFLIASTVSVETAEGIAAGRVQAPQPRRLEDPILKEPLNAYVGRIWFRVPLMVAKDASPGPRAVTVTVKTQACDDKRCLLPETTTLGLTVLVDPEAVGDGNSRRSAIFRSSDGPQHGSRSPSDQASKGERSEEVSLGAFGREFVVDTGSAIGMGLLLAVAALGGFLLNLTPCVLPIIPIKVMGLSQVAGHPRRCFVLGVFVSLGVVAFWTALAVVMATITSFTAVNQMFQLPLFTIGVGVFIAVMAFGMCGLFTVRLPQFVYHITPQQDTYSGSFLFGIMIAVLSTPCTAPFMGAALGWSVRQLPAVSLATFAAVGVGMALPYLVLAAWPRLVAKVPHTGPASVLVKQVMGLLMLAAAAYFVGVGVTALTASPQGSAGRFYWWPVMLLVASGGVWMAWRTVRFSRSAIARALVIGLGGVMAFGAVALAVRLTAQGPVNWVHYTPERFEGAVREGKVVVLDFTAEWCLNCKALEESVLRNPTIVDRLKKDSVMPMKVDLTTGRNRVGRRMLERMERLTIPLLVIFGPDGNALFKSDFYTVEQVARALDEAMAPSAPRRPAN